MKRPSVYVHQFGYFWKLSDEQWLDLLRSGAAGNGYVLPEDQELRSRPKWARKGRYEGADFYTEGDHRLFGPLDWTPEEFQWCLDEEMKDRA